MTAERINWDHVLEFAATIVNSYSTSVTLHQLFYRLVAAQVLPNSNSAYKTLSSKTAEARRAGDSPDLIDRGRKIHRRQAWQVLKHEAADRKRLSKVLASIRNDH